MSANNNGADSGRSTGFSSLQQNPHNNTTSMELSPPRYSSQKISNTPRDTDMSTLTMRAHSVLPSARELLWDDRRPLELPSRPRSQVDRIELPSIRQAVPELHLRVGRDDLQPRSFSPPTSRPTSAVTPTNYAHSPSMNKRRRLSIEEERDSESRDYPGSRVYRSPPRQTRPQSGGTSPSSSRRISGSWSGSNRTSPFLPSGGLPSMRSPPPFDTPSASRAEWRPTLPSLPALTFERSPQPSQTPRTHSNWSEYALDASHPGAQTYSQTPPSFSPPQSNFHPQPFSYSGYQQPRNPSYSGPSTHSAAISHDRTPFSSLGYHPQNLQATHEGYLSAYGDMVLSGDSKTRKRRGNLPKETTDKLRAWFVAHLQHPYPTEDEKQELMRLTGLQMNQISNWFINARRRQLPTMINNARAESDARSARSADGAAQGTGRGSVGLGESEGEYEDEFETTSSMGGMGKREPKSI